MLITSSRKKSPIINSVTPLFFSLVDYRNNYFTSHDPNKIMEFYNGFNNRNQLIQWMKERPKGVSEIHEVDGNKNIIVVIPTADFNGKHAIECRDNIFKGLHVIFVESGEFPDPYFNYAHNVNTGIKKAMEYDPKWVVVSNDDMYRIDDISILISQLSEIDNNKYFVVYALASTHHTVSSVISRPRITRTILFKLIGKNRRLQLVLENRFSINYFLISLGGYMSLFFKKEREITIISIGDFVIFSSKLLNYWPTLYDETFINASEDSELSFRIALKVRNKKIIGYRIGSYIGGTFSDHTTRRLHEIASLSYFDFILKGYL